LINEFSLPATLDLNNPNQQSPIVDVLTTSTAYYLEGLEPNSDLAVQLIYRDEGGNEIARDEVHLEILDTTPINVTAIANSGLGEAVVKNYLTAHIQGANAVRRDRDGPDEDADTIVPVVFRLGELLPPDETNLNWLDLTRDGPDEELSELLQFLDGVDADIYVSSIIRNQNNNSFAAGVTEQGVDSGMCVAINFSVGRVIAHEWLHARGNLGHQCIDNHLMTGSIDNGPTPCGATDGTDTRQHESDLF
jgi:hypothetical protein